MCEVVICRLTPGATQRSEGLRTCTGVKILCLRSYYYFVRMNFLLTLLVYGLMTNLVLPETVKSEPNAGSVLPEPTGSSSVSTVSLTKRPVEELQTENSEIKTQISQLHTNAALRANPHSFSLNKAVKATNEFEAIMVADEARAQLLTAILTDKLQETRSVYSLTISTSPHHLTPPDLVEKPLARDTKPTVTSIQVHLAAVPDTTKFTTTSIQDHLAAVPDTTFTFDLATYCKQTTPCQGKLDGYHNSLANPIRARRKHKAGTPIDDTVMVKDNDKEQRKALLIKSIGRVITRTSLCLSACLYCCNLQPASALILQESVRNQANQAVT